MKTSRIPTPKGFRTKVIKYANNIYVELYQRGSTAMIGRINLAVTDSFGKKMATHSYLDANYYNKGLGAFLYSKAIEWALEHGWKVRSSGSSSEQAKRVWKGRTIRKYFRLRKSSTGDTWYILGMK